MEEDISLDLKSLEREDIIARLNNASTNQNTNQLRSQLRTQIMNSHPIHEVLRKLTNEELNNLQRIVFHKDGNRKYDRMRNALTKYFFQKFPSAPMTSLKHALKTGKITED